LPGWSGCKTCIQISPNSTIIWSFIQPNGTDKISFSNKIEDTKSTLYLGDGWSWKEGWGVWSDGKEASLYLPISENKPKSLSLNFNSFLVTNVHPNQSIELWINGIFYRQFDFNQFEDNKITIFLSHEMLVRDFLELNFSFKNPGRPKELLGNNQDNRQLGIGLVSVQFEF
jgi:hypothetical protein